METTNTPKEVLQNLADHAILTPGLSAPEIKLFQQRLPGPLPKDIEELLTYAAGFRSPSSGTVSFTGTPGFEFTRVFPFAIPLLADGLGNFWVVDINGNTGSWDAVFFASHDPAVIVVQASDLRAFIAQTLDHAGTSPRNALDYVRNQALNRIWGSDPWVVPVKQARALHDPVLSNFAKELPDNFRVADLRSKEIGSGFKWATAGPDTVIRRKDQELIFGIQEKPLGLVSRVLRRVGST